MPKAPTTNARKTQTTKEVPPMPVTKTNAVVTAPKADAAATAATATESTTTKRTAPKGPGLFDPTKLVKAAPPAVKRAGGPGRAVDPESRAVIDHLVANPNETFLIGVFGSATSSLGAWADADIVFVHRKHVAEDGTETDLFDRYATCVPGSKGRSRKDDDDATEDAAEG
jgi:hypothetical protein